MYEAHFGLSARPFGETVDPAAFVPLPSRNHLVLEHEPAWQVMQRELGEFLGWT